MTFSIPSPAVLLSDNLLPTQTGWHGLCDVGQLLDLLKPDMGKGPRFLVGGQLPGNILQNRTSQGPRPRGWWQMAELAGAAWGRGPSDTSRLKGRGIFQEPSLEPRLRRHTPVSTEPSGAAVSRQKGVIWNVSSQELLPSSQTKSRRAHRPPQGGSVQRL